MSKAQRKLCGGCYCDEKGDCVKNKSGVVVGCNYKDVLCESCLGCKNFTKPTNSDLMQYIKKNEAIQNDSNNIEVNNTSTVNCSKYHKDVMKCGAYSQCNYCKVRDEHKCVSNTMKKTLENMGELNDYSCFPRIFYSRDVNDPSIKQSDSKGVNSFDHQAYINKKNKLKPSTVPPEAKEKKERNERTKTNGNDKDEYVFLGENKKENKKLQYANNSGMYYDATMNSEIQYVDEDEPTTQQMLTLPEGDEKGILDKLKEEKNEISKEVYDYASKLVDVEEVVDDVANMVEEVIEDVSSVVAKPSKKNILLFSLVVATIILFYVVLFYLYKKFA